MEVRDRPGPSPGRTPRPAAARFPRSRPPFLRSRPGGSAPAPPFASDPSIARAARNRDAMCSIAFVQRTLRKPVNQHESGDVAKVAAAVDECCARKQARRSDPDGRNCRASCRRSAPTCRRRARSSKRSWLFGKLSDDFRGQVADASQWVARRRDQQARNGLEVLPRKRELARADEPGDGWRESARSTSCPTAAARR